jgi:chemotaxis response regulator CheB
VQPVDLDRRKRATFLVTIAASAGAFPVIYDLVAKLRDLKAAVAVILHTGRGSTLATTLSMRSTLGVLETLSGDLLQDGNV